MRSCLKCALFFGAVFSPLLIAAAVQQNSAPAEDPAILQADRAFLQASARGDQSALNNLLDADFTWTDSQGKTLARSEVLQTAPKSALGDESAADVKERTYGDVAAVTASRGKIHILRIWVKRPAGWRALVYHQVTQLDQPPAAAGSGVNTCDNPCKTLPFQPANAAEQAVIASWQALETGVTSHDAGAWAPHIAEEFVQISSNSDHPIDKAGRIATLNKQKESGVGSAPAPLVSARMFDFGDTIVMTCLHQPYAGKPIHVSRVWIKRDGAWVMSISYQTAIQSASPKTS